jgi:hypothetical protein
MEPNPYLVGTSVLFAIPTSMAAYYRQWHLYSPFLFLTISSSVYHATKYQPLLFLDYPGCYWVVYALVTETLAIQQPCLCIVSATSCTILFWGGYLLKRFVHSPDSFEQTTSHVLMHLIVVVTGIITSYLASNHKVILNENQPDR